MRALIAGLFLALAMLGQVDIDEQLSRAAKSPYDIARFVDTHVTFNWEPLWKALGIQGNEVLMQPCGESGGSRPDCYEELVTVLDPFQVILILRHNLPMPEVYLRFFRRGGFAGAGPWRFGGHYTPYVKYFEPWHRTLRLGGKPFLVVTRQGASGSDVSGEVEDWIDLTLPTLEPVLSVTTKGRYSSLPDHFDLESAASVTDAGSGAAESVEVFYDAIVRHAGRTVAQRSTKATYTRHGRNFAFDADRSNVSRADIEKIYDVGSATNEDVVRYFFTGLMEVAAGNDVELKRWLIRFLEGSKDTTEKRELLPLLRKTAGTPPTRTSPK